VAGDLSSSWLMCPEPDRARGASGQVVITDNG
jgi:hypothetical protein